MKFNSFQVTSFKIILGEYINNTLHVHNVISAVIVLGQFLKWNKCFLTPFFILYLEPHLFPKWSRIFRGPHKNNDN